LAAERYIISAEGQGEAQGIGGNLTLALNGLTPKFEDEKRN
jgi:hypothetical protein